MNDMQTSTDSNGNEGQSYANRGDNDRSSGDVIGSAAMRPIFLGNLIPGYNPDHVTDIFERPFQPKLDANYYPIRVDRIDQKRGYCFVFLKDANSQAEKEAIERFVVDITGIEVPNVSRALRAEFARGDGRVKRKEDERRKNIAPSETLFVVNFHEGTTRQEDLQMLFSPFGELVRIDMKRNYAFVQFRTIEQATKAKEATNGGKLDQSVITVEYVARQREGEAGGGRDRRRRYDGRRNDRPNDRFRRDSPPRGGPPPPRRSHSRSRSPPRYGYRPSRSPPRGRMDVRNDRFDGGDRYDDYRDRRGGAPPSPPPPPPQYRGRSPEYNRGRSPPNRDNFRGDRDRDRGYRG